MSTDDEAFSYPELLTDPRLLAITLVSVSGTFGSYAASPALPSIVSGLGVTESDVGLVMAAYTLPAVVLLPVIGVLTDTYGRRAVLLPALFLFAVAGMAITFVDSFRAILVLRAIQGIGGAAMIPIAITLIGDLYSGAAGSTAQGIRLSANGLSSILLPVGAGFLAGLAWNFPFLLYGIGIPALVLAYLFVPETVDGSAYVSVMAEIREYASQIRAEVTDTDVGILLLGGFFQGFSYYGILTFVPLFAVSNLGTSLLVAGGVLSARGVARILLSPTTGLMLRYLSRKHALFLTLVVTAVGTGFIGVAPNVAWLVALVGVFGVGDALFTPVHRDAITDLASDERRAGVVSGMLILYRSGATLAPIALAAVLVVAGFGPLFLIAGSFYAGYALVVLAFFGPDG